MGTSTSPKRGKSLKDAVSMVEGSSIVALDLETTHLDPRKGYIRLAQVCNVEESYVIEVSKIENTRPLFEALSDKIVLAHGDFEWRWIYHHYGIELKDVRDTMLLSHLVAAGDPSLSSGLGAVALRELGVELDKEMQTSDWSADTLSKRQLDYAAMDAKVLFPIYRSLILEVIDLGLEDVAEIENKALPAFARMKLEGLPVDHAAWIEQAEKVEQEFQEITRGMLEAEWMPAPDPVPQSWRLSGDDCVAMLRAAGLEGVEGSTAKDLKKFGGHELVDALLESRRKGSDVTKKDVIEIAERFGAAKPPSPAPPWNFKSTEQVKEIAYELTGEWLENTEEGTLVRFVDRHQFFKEMLRFRKVKKLVDTYGRTWFQDAYDDQRGRVYPAWRQIGTSTGRVASGSKKDRAPNAQNIPSDYRRFFVAPEGRTFVNLDYSQIEVRVIAKMFNVKGLLEVFEKEQDVYKMTAAGMLGIEVEEITIEQRQLAKAILLGMLYGLSEYGLPAYTWKNYGIKDMSQADAEAYVRAFYDLYPEIEEYHSSTLEALEKDGYVDKRTMTGRLRAGITVRNEALNAPIQGTAADGLKLGMALVHERLRELGGTAFIIATVHDELLVECNEGDAEHVYKIVEKAMLGALNEIVNAEGDPVPITVSGGITKVWTKD